MTTQRHELRRSRSDRMIAGVCGGLAQFFGISAFWFRLGFLIALVPGGIPGLCAVRDHVDHRPKRVGCFPHFTGKDIPPHRARGMSLPIVLQRYMLANAKHLPDVDQIGIPKPIENAQLVPRGAEPGGNLCERVAALDDVRPVVAVSAAIVAAAVVRVLALIAVGPGSRPTGPDSHSRRSPDSRSHHCRPASRRRSPGSRSRHCRPASRRRSPDSRSHHCRPASRRRSPGSRSHHCCPASRRRSPDSRSHHYCPASRRCSRHPGTRHRESRWSGRRTASSRDSDWPASWPQPSCRIACRSRRECRPSGRRSCRSHCFRPTHRRLLACADREHQESRCNRGVQDVPDSHGDPPFAVSVVPGIVWTPVLEAGCSAVTTTVVSATSAPYVYRRGT